MTDKEKLEQMIDLINKLHPTMTDIRERMGYVYKVLAMDENEFSTLDEFRGQNKDYVLERLQKEGLELGKELSEIEAQVVNQFGKKYTEIVDDLVILYEYDVNNFSDIKDLDIKDLDYITDKDLREAFPEQPSAELSDKDKFDEIVSDIDDIEEPNITLNPDGSTTEIIDSSYTDDLGIEYGVQQEINRDVPIEEFKTVFGGGSPSDYKMPKILDDLKDTKEYSRAQFQLWSLELEYQDRQKFKKIVERQYEIFYEFIKENPNLSIENKKILLGEIRQRTLMLDEKYRKFTVKNDVDLSLEELTTFDNELDDINTNFKSKLEGALDNIKLGLPNDLNRDVRHLQIDELALSDEYKKYLNEIIKDTDFRLNPETIRKLDNVLDTTAGQQAVETMILNMRNGITKHGAYSLHTLMQDYGANYFKIMGAKQELAGMYWSRIDEILESNLNLNVPDPDLEMKMQFDFAESKLRELGVSDIEIENIKKTNEFFLTGDERLDASFDAIVSNIDNNVIDLNNQVTINTEYGSGRDITVTVDRNGNVVLFRGTDDPNRGINVNFESQVGQGEVGYGKGNYYSPNPQYAANYAQGGGRKLYGYSTDIKPNEILNFRTKISDNVELAKKLGVEDIYWDVSNPNYQQNITWYDLFYEMDREDVWNKAIQDWEVTKESKYGRSWFQNNIDIFKENGVKAFITTEVGPANYTKAEIFPLVTETNNLNIKPVVQYSVDGAGVNLSQFTETPLDTPTNVIDIREKQLEKLMQEVEEATPDVTKITSSQAEMIDNALADAAAQLSRNQFNVIQGSIGKKYTAQQILKLAGQKLGKLFVDGITLIDIYELGLIAYALGEPVVELITKFIFPDLETESPTYGQQVMENFEVITKISPTDRLLMKAADEIEEQFGFRPGDISEEITSVDTSPVRPVLYSPDSDRTVPVQSFTPPSIYEKTKERFQPATLEEKTGYDEYNQFLKAMHGMLGGNNE